MTEPLYSIRGWKIHNIHDAFMLTIREHTLRPLAYSGYYDAWETPHVISRNGVNANGAGFWGLFPQNPEALRQLDRYRPAAVGVIEHRGSVLQYEYGYRSDRAVVRFVQLLRHVPSHIIDDFSNRYDCEVVPRMTWPLRALVAIKTFPFAVLTPHSLWISGERRAGIKRCQRWLQHQRKIDHALRQGQSVS